MVVHHSVMQCLDFINHKCSKIGAIKSAPVFCLRFLSPFDFDQFNAQIYERYYTNIGSSSGV